MTGFTDPTTTDMKTTRHDLTCPYDDCPGEEHHPPPRPVDEGADDLGTTRRELHRLRRGIRAAVDELRAVHRLVEQHGSVKGCPVCYPQDPGLCTAAGVSDDLAALLNER